MSAHRRPVRPLLSLQATALVVLTAAVGMWTWKTVATYEAEVQAPRLTLDSARKSARTLMTGPYLYLATGEASHVDATQDAVTELNAHLLALSHLAPLPPKQVERARASLQVIEEATGLLWKAAPDADLAGALEQLALGTSALDGSLTAIETRIEAQVTERYDLTLQGLLVAWGGMLVAVLGTGVLASRRDGTNVERELRIQRSLNVELADALADAAQPPSADAPLPEIVSIAGAGVDSLVGAARRTVEALGELRTDLARLRRSSSFTQDLMDALAMAESEVEVVSTASRAARVAYPDASYQLLRIEGDDALLRPVDAMPEPACAVDGAERCPAVRKGRTLHHGIGQGIVRCPHLAEDSGCVTCAPVLLNGHAYGVSQLAGYIPSQTGLDDLESLGLALAARLGVVRSLAASEREASTDPLTGLANRRRFTERLADLDRNGSHYCLIVADIDHFKAINDRHGHEVGDRCLQIFAQVLRDACRNSDLPCRHGGEEFVAVLPDAGMRAGLAVAMRIRALLREAGRKAPTPFTVSMGVAAHPNHGDQGDRVLRAADAAMYDAKESGRDQVIPAHLALDVEASA